MTFAPDWLDLREPLDHASRDAGLLTCARELVGDGLVVDLGSGTGSTARAFGAGRWRFVDGNAQLLQIATVRHEGCETCLTDLGDIDALPLAGAALVTASALLDLMPRDWVMRLAHRLARAGLPFYSALNYNGRMSWVPEQPQDAAITAAFNAHQTGDKGLGPALGPQAGDATAQIFAQAGFDVMTADSPWRIALDHGALHDVLLDGIAAAVLEAGHAGAPDWLKERKAALDAGYIGHTDVVAIPRGAGE